jgi:hypothetical protein
VSKDFRGFREINTVTFDPSLISPEQMISTLKQAGTYIGVSQAQEVLGILVDGLFIGEAHLF